MKHSIYALSFLFIIICTFANATTDPVRSYNQQSDINTYNRNGSFNGTWSSGVSAQYYVYCSSGSWSDKHASGICYYAGSDSCATTGCNITWPQRNASASDIHVSRINSCTSSICLSENTDAPGSGSNQEITTEPNSDPMLAIIPGGDGYIEFITSYDGLAVNTIHWLRRVGGLNKNLMIPTKKVDYLHFLSHTSPSVLHTESACMPAHFSAYCPSQPSCGFCPPPPPP